MTKRWIGICMAWAVGVGLWLSGPATAQVQQLGRMPIAQHGQVQRASHCTSGCASDMGPLWASGPCGGCATVPTIVGPACRCGGCGRVLGEFVCDVKNGLDRGLRCVLGAILPCGLCPGNYDVCSSMACSSCGSCDMAGPACGCDDGCAYDGGVGIPSQYSPQPMPQPTLMDPFQDDPPVPNQTSALRRPHAAAPMAQTYRADANKRPNIRRTTYRQPERSL